MATTTAPRAASHTRSEPSGWAIGLAAFAAFMLVLIGTFQFFEGLAAVMKDQYYVIASGYAFNIDVTAWGWIHMIAGVIVVMAGFAVLSGRVWGRVIGIIVAILSAIAQFFYIPYYPVWAVLIIALNVACIWALSVYGHREAESL